jgi:uncharacterized phage protein (TIGR01671 family)
MREIKFRAFKQGSKELVYGSLVQSAKGESCIIEQTPHDPVHKTSSFWDINAPAYSIIPETVGQFTNLNDKNGEESYVGDILKEILNNAEERFFKIFQVPGGFAINTFQDDFYKPVEQIQFWTALSDMQTALWFKSSLEIIGNVFENPELLNQTP